MRPILVEFEHPPRVLDEAMESAVVAVMAEAGFGRGRFEGETGEVMAFFRCDMEGDEEAVGIGGPGSAAGFVGRYRHIALSFWRDFGRYRYGIDIQGDYEIWPYASHHQVWEVQFKFEPGEMTFRGVCLYSSVSGFMFKEGEERDVDLFDNQLIRFLERVSINIQQVLGAPRAEALVDMNEDPNGEADNRRLFLRAPEGNVSIPECDPVWIEPVKGY